MVRSICNGWEVEQLAYAELKVHAWYNLGICPVPPLELSTTTTLLITLTY